MAINELIKNDLKNIIATLNWVVNVVVEEVTPDDYFEMLAKFVDISKYSSADLICAGVTYCKEADGKNAVCFFIDGIRRAMALNGSVDLAVIVKHEYRHHLQFAWLREVGGSDLVSKVLADEINAPYGQGVLENDAKLFSEKGIDRPFTDVFASYLAA